MQQDRRSAERCIFHVDVNSAFLSWSSLRILKENPDAVDLRTVPSAVGGDVQKRHGVITAKSIPAKKYGIRTGEPVVKALQKCPDLILVPPDFTTYRKYSRALMKILHKYSDIVEQASIDEAYMDMTGLADRFEQDWEKTGEPFPLCAARKIKDEVRERLGFTVNVGISVNKLLAKTASDFTKPDRIHTLYPDEMEAKFWPLPIDRLFGCGPASAQKLKNIGIATIGDAAHTEEEILQSVLGEKAGTYIFRSSRGISDAPVLAESREAKGYSNELTTTVDITAENYDAEMTPLLDSLCGSVSRRLQKDEVRAFTVGVTVKTDLFQRHTRQTTLADSISDERTIRTTADRLMRELLFGKKNAGGLFSSGRAVRLVGVFASGLDRGSCHQMSLTEAMEAMRLAKEEQERRRLTEEQNRRQEEALRQMEETIRSRFGENALHRGTADGRERKK